jgi:hypothetical protein
MINSHVESVR